MQIFLNFALVLLKNEWLLSIKQPAPIPTTFVDEVVFRHQNPWDYFLCMSTFFGKSRWLSRVYWVPQKHLINCRKSSFLQITQSKCGINQSNPKVSLQVSCKKGGWRKKEENSFRGRTTVVANQKQFALKSTRLEKKMKKKGIFLSTSWRRFYLRWIIYAWRHAVTPDSSRNPSVSL